MNALVLYESEFGNTQQIARAITSVLARHGAARLESIYRLGHSVLEGVDLLILGSPTQYQEATPDMLAWLDRIPPRALYGMPVGVFDTRYHLPRLLAGSAAESISKTIQQQGGNLIAPPKSFFVTEREGPLEAGEIERAASWAGMLVAKAAAARA